MVEPQRDHAAEPIAVPRQQRSQHLAVALGGLPKQPVCFTRLAGHASDRFLDGDLGILDQAIPAGQHAARRIRSIINRARGGTRDRNARCLTPSRIEDRFVARQYQGSSEVMSLSPTRIFRFFVPSGNGCAVEGVGELPRSIRWIPRILWRRTVRHLLSMTRRPERRRRVALRVRFGSMHSRIGHFSPKSSTF